MVALEDFAPSEEQRSLYAGKPAFLKLLIKQCLTDHEAQQYVLMVRCIV